MGHHYIWPIFYVSHWCFYNQALADVRSTGAGIKCLYCIWEKAWKIEDLYWSFSAFLHKDNDLPVRSIGRTRYLSWWDLSDKYPIMIRICEIMAKLLTHASKLKGDDIRLKSLTPCHRVCPNCDMYIKEDLLHVVMQCPIHEPLRRNMCNTLYQIDDRIERIL